MFRAGKVFDCPCGLKSSYNACVLSSLEYCAPGWMSSAESLSDLLDSILFAVRKGCVKVSFVIWGTEGKSVPCACSMRFITEWTTL